MITFVFENTFEGFLTAIYDAFYAKDDIYSIISKDDFNFDLLSETIYVESNFEKYTKVKDSIVTKIDPLALKLIYNLFLSNQKDKGYLCYKYLKVAYRLGSNIHKHHHLSVVKELNLINRKVSLEGHRYTGFVRFKYINNKFLYSAIEPDHNILEIIAPHFKRRFANEYFIIHDIKRNLAIIYDKKDYIISEVDKNLYDDLKDYKDSFDTLWKDYFKSTTIKERTNLKLQKRQMPLRYWHLLNELEEDEN